MIEERIDKERRKQYTGWSPAQTHLTSRVPSYLEYLAAHGKDWCPEFASGTEREFRLVDADNNGAISRGEFMAAHGEDSGAEFDQADTNKDGELSRLEYLSAYGKVSGAMSADAHAKVQGPAIGPRFQTSLYSFISRIRFALS